MTAFSEKKFMTFKHTFRKYERLYLKKQIDAVFKKGKQFRAFPFFVRFMETDDLDYIAKVMFVVPKKKFKRAVKRNRIKRLMKEAYRLNKHQLYECLQKNNRKILIVVSYFQDKLPDYKTVENGITDIFTKICASIGDESS